MNPIVKSGTILGLAVVGWTFIMGITGWYVDPVLLSLFWVVIPIQLTVMLWGMKKTAVVDSSLANQIKSGFLMSLVGGVIIFAGSMLFTGVAFPNYFADIHKAYESMMKAQGMPEKEIQALLDQQAAMQTPFWQALFGLIGTIVTGLIAALIIGIVQKHSKRSLPQA